MTSRSQERSAQDDLLRRAAAGDEQAFASLMVRYDASLRRAISRRITADLAPRFDTSDVLQETRIMAFRRLPEFVDRRPMPFSDWLRCMAREQFLLFRRRHLNCQKRSVRYEVRQPESSLLLAKSLYQQGRSPSSVFAREESIQRLCLALDQLAEEDREILRLRYLERISNKAAAARLGISEPAACKRHGAAIMRLGRQLKREETPKR